MYRCPICNRDFGSKSGFANHSRSCSDNYLLENTIQFDEGNEIKYSQDFKVRIGVPSGIVFEIVEKFDGSYVLEAPGLQMRAIRVDKEDIKKQWMKQRNL